MERLTKEYYRIPRFRDVLVDIKTDIGTWSRQSWSPDRKLGVSDMVKLAHFTHTLRDVESLATVRDPPRVKESLSQDSHTSVTLFTKEGFPPGRLLAWLVPEHSATDPSEVGAQLSEAGLPTTPRIKRTGVRRSRVPQQEQRRRTKMSELTTGIFQRHRGSCNWCVNVRRRTARP